MTKTMTLALTLALIACSEDKHTTSTTSGEVQQFQQEQQQELSGTTQQLDYLVTECDDNNEIDLSYDDVIIVSASHWTAGDWREPVQAWGPGQDESKTMIAYCQEQVHVTYMWK